MKSFNQLIFALLLGCATASLMACSDDEPTQDPTGLSEKEQALRAAVIPYVDNTVLPTYCGMADAAVELYEQCLSIREKFAAGTLTEADVAEAGNTWKRSRKYWELSEAFLFGPVTDQGLDPNMDSWPLDQEGIVNVLKTGNWGDMDWSGDYDEDNSQQEQAQSLRGFHTLEYLLFKDGKAREVK